jgi:hypothetical protein
MVVEGERRRPMWGVLANLEIGIRGLGFRGLRIFEVWGFLD